MKKLEGEAWLSSRQKRLEDIALTVGILPFAGSAGMVGALAVGVVDRVNPLFIQSRVGLNNEAFNIYKLRTMPQHVDAVPSLGKHDDIRASRVGKILRKLRVDETPQIWNVWQGSMSVIGPRALVVADYEHARDVLDRATYKEWIDARSQARPGIFDEYGVRYHSGELGANTEEVIKHRAEIDITYIADASHATDINILMNTFKLFGKTAVSWSPNA